MAPPHACAPGVRTAIGLAVRTLPTREDRSRYLDEYLGDLSGLSPREQLRYAAGALSQAFALRAALRSAPGSLREPLSMRERWRWTRCHLLRQHCWKTFSAEDGSRCTACAVCRKEHPGELPGGGPAGMAPFILGFGGQAGMGGFG